MPNILNLITTGVPDNHPMLLLDRMPDFKYFHVPSTGKRVIIAHDDGFYNTFVHKVDRHAKAFGGRKFTIPMLLSDEEDKQADGQWWSSGQQYIPEPYTYVPIATIEKLVDCFVFSAGYMSTEKLQEFLHQKVYNTRNQYHIDYYMLQDVITKAKNISYTKAKENLEREAKWKIKKLTKEG